MDKTDKTGTLNLEQEDENPSSQRSMSEKLNLLLEYQKLPRESNGEWLRKNGLHEEHLTIFQQEIKTQRSSIGRASCNYGLKKKLGWMEEEEGEV